MKAVTVGAMGWCVCLACWCVVQGCGPGAPEMSSTPVSRDLAAEIKPGMTRSEIEAKLGPAYPATAEQTQALNSMMERMPPKVRESAKQGTDIAWGNEVGWLAGRMNDENKVWMISTRYGQP